MLPNNTLGCRQSARKISDNPHQSLISEALSLVTHLLAQCKITSAVGERRRDCDQPCASSSFAARPASFSHAGWSITTAPTNGDSRARLPQTVRKGVSCCYRHESGPERLFLAHEAVLGSGESLSHVGQCRYTAIIYLPSCKLMK